MINNFNRYNNIYSATTYCPNDQLNILCSCSDYCDDDSDAVSDESDYFDSDIQFFDVDTENIDVSELVSDECNFDVEEDIESLTDNDISNEQTDKTDELEKFDLPDITDNSEKNGLAAETDLEHTTPEWIQTVLDKNPELTEKMLSVLEVSPDARTWQETEIADYLRYPNFETQKSILTDETGIALVDDNGEFVECPRNTKGAHRPDGFYIEDGKIHMHEIKNYHDVNNLKQNIAEQTEKRFASFGDDIDLTYVLAPNFSVEESDELQEYIESLGANIEWQLK